MAWLAQAIPELQVGQGHGHSLGHRGGQLPDGLDLILGLQAGFPQMKQSP